MIRSLICILFWLTLSPSSLALAANSDSARKDDAHVAASLTQLTTLSFSPLLVGGYRGAYTYYKTPIEQRESLPWDEQPWFWSALLAVGLLFTFNGLLGILFGPLKKFMDAAETVEGKITPIYASAMVVPLGIELMRNLELSGISAIPFSSAQAASIVNVTTAPTIASMVLGAIVALAIFGVIWLGNQAIHTIVLLAPFGIIGTTLRLLQLLFLGTFLLIAALSPFLGACISLLLIFTSLRLAGWSFRLSIFGTVFAWDLLWFNKKFPANTRALAFSGSGLTLPPRTLGYLQRRQGRLELEYRPWLIGRVRRLSISEGSITLTHGLFYSQLHQISESGEMSLASLPPRYRESETTLAQLTGASPRPSVLKGGVTAVLTWLRSISKM